MKDKAEREAEERERRRAIIFAEGRLKTWSLVASDDGLADREREIAKLRVKEWKDELKRLRGDDVEN